MAKDLAYPEKTKKMFAEWPGKAPTSPRDLLEEAGIPIDTVDEVIFSHTHL